MKPFFGIDITTNKNNEIFNGTEFLVAKPSYALEQARDRSSGKAEETLEKSKLPRALRILQTICGSLGIIIVVGILRGLFGNDGVSLSEGYQNVPWLYWLGGICLAVWGVLIIMSKRKESSVLGTDEAAHTLTQLDDVCKSIYAELAVPKYAPEVDILTFFYKVKNGEIKVREKGMQLAPYLNPVFRVYADEENLYLANLDGKFAFPRSSIVTVRTIDKRICTSSWNKDEAYNKGYYKTFKLNTDNYGRIHSKPYYILEVQHQGESWGIYIPCYEYPVFDALLKYTEKA